MRSRVLAAFVTSSGMLFGAWCLGAGPVSDDVRPVSDREAARIAGGACNAVSPSADCAEKSTKNGMPEACPGGTLQTICEKCDGNVSFLYNTSCVTPCSSTCGTKTTAYKDCDGEKHNF